MDKFTLARLMGHSSPRIAERYYIHITEPHVVTGFERFSAYQATGFLDAIKERTQRLQEDLILGNGTDMSGEYVLTEQGSTIIGPNLSLARNRATKTDTIGPMNDPGLPQSRYFSGVWFTRSSQAKSL